MTKEEIKDKLKQWKNSFKLDPSDTPYQDGYEAALTEALELFDDEEASSPEPR